MPTDEEKLLAILEQPDVEPVEDAAPLVLDEKQRATLQRLLDKQMPSPEEIARDAEINEHNAEVQRLRQVKLARRQERQAKNPKRRRRR